jgi:hypothetical protein
VEKETHQDCREQSLLLLLVLVVLLLQLLLLFKLVLPRWVRMLLLHATGSVCRLWR